MAPMALFALEDATGIDYSDAIYSGLSWVTDTNELGRDLSDGERQMIWRGVYRGSRLGISTTRALSLLGKEDRTMPVGDLLLRSECRPYELGWLLYAFAGCVHGARVANNSTAPAERRHVSPNSNAPDGLEVAKE
jgi:hypothetical protein